MARLGSIIMLGAALLAGVPATAQHSPAAERGEQTFEQMCAPCHGGGLDNDGRALLPGTNALQIKYRGALPALLTERSDLNFESIRSFVRNGVFSMPPFRPSELTDDDIRDIAAYISETSKPD